MYTIALTLEPECAHPWRVSYHGFSAKGNTAFQVLVQRSEVLGHEALTYDFLIKGIKKDLKRSIPQLTQPPHLTFSDNFTEKAQQTIRASLLEVFAQPRVS